MPQRRKLQLIVAASTLTSFIAAVGAVYFATARYESATRDAQAARASQFVERYVHDVVWQRHADEVTKLAGDVANENRLRSAVAAADREALVHLLPVVARRYAVTSGQVALVGVTVYDASAMTLAEYSTAPDLHAPRALGSLLSAREHNERFSWLRHVWTFEGKPYLSVAVPIGGLKQITGYLAVHVNPLHVLRDLPNRLAMHVTLTSLDGAQTLAELNDYELPAEATKMTAEAIILSPDEKPVFRVAMSSDETASTRIMASIRMWCFIILFAALCLIALATLALVLFVSRRMAREEAEAAKVVLEARQTEERNGELQRLNDALRASEETLQAQNERFDAALNNMTHGMCMFDKDERLVVCNNVYLEMYGLSPELAEPGTPLRTILKARAASSAAPVDAGDYTAHVVDIVSRKDTRYGVRELRDGRFVAIAHKPMPGGGWVAVHQDVTAQKRAENAIARMTRQEAGRVDVRERMHEPAPA